MLACRPCSHSCAASTISPLQAAVLGAVQEPHGTSARLEQRACTSCPRCSAGSTKGSPSTSRCTPARSCRARDCVLERLVDAAHRPVREGRAAKASREARTLWLLLIVATIPAAIVGKLLDDIAEQQLRNLLLQAGTLTVFGALLWLADRTPAKGDDERSPGWFTGIAMGLAQCLALIAGRVALGHHDDGRTVPRPLASRPARLSRSCSRRRSRSGRSCSSLKDVLRRCRRRRSRSAW